MKKKLIFLTLMITATMLATSIPVTAETLSPDHTTFWVVHDNEDPELKGDGQVWAWRDNLGMQHEVNWGIHDEIWYTDSDDPSSLHPGEIRPIRDEGWHQNTWIKTTITVDDPYQGDATLHTKIYSPNNIYPEFFNWTIGDGHKEDAYFRIRAYDWDTGEEMCNFTHEVVVQVDTVLKDKLDAWIDQFRFELDYYDGTQH